jgi:hypothetical protein
MARYDKYDGIVGGFRAALEADITGNAAGEFGPVGVSINTAGRAIVGSAGASGLVGILVKNAPKQPVQRFSTDLNGTPAPRAWLGQKAGDVVDIMTAGEIVGVTGWNPGDIVYAATTGVLSTTNTGVKVGWIVGSGTKLRMVIRFAA